MKFDYAGACHRIVPPTTTPAITTTTEINPPPSPLCVPPADYDISPLIKYLFNLARINFALFYMDFFNKGHLLGPLI